MDNRKRIAFVCLHGSAKSLIAAEYLNRCARERHLDLFATTSGPEPDATVPSNVVEGLLRRNIDARQRNPERVNAEALANAAHIVPFGCDLQQFGPPGGPVERWDDCPAVSDDFDVAWEFIATRVDELVGRVVESDGKRPCVG